MRLLYWQHPHLLVVGSQALADHHQHLLARVREVSDAPVILVTARATTTDKVTALTTGFDDIVAHPWEMAELLARVRALLRRRQLATASPAGPCFDDGWLRVDCVRHRVWRGEQAIKLSPLEFRMLACLVRQRGWVVTHEQLLATVWGPHCVYDASYVKLYIKYLRNKIEVDPSRPRYIHTEWGVGYYFEDRSSRLQPVLPTSPRRAAGTS
jgi:two-component system KDP operon response regulator KdpE